MKYAFPLAAVIALVLIALIGVQIPGMQYLFGVVIPYLAMALFWAMSAGFVAGVGFRPRKLLIRLLLSPLACWLGVILAGLRLASLTPEAAVRLARATLRSAAAGVEGTEALDALIDRVASPGGVTPSRPRHSSRALP